MVNKLIRANDGTLVGNSFFAIGSVQQTFLSAIEFESIMGTDWVLADGRDVSGSRYETITGNSTVPDVRGRFLRTVGGNANATIGGTQEDDLGSHNHNVELFETATGVFAASKVASGQNVVQGGQLTSDTGGTETRPVNITVNTFIKVN